MAADNESTRANGVEVSLAEGHGWARTLTVSVPEERVTKTRAAETGRLSRSLRLKGFRKGKVPAAVVEQRFGGELDDRVQQRLLDEAYREALDQAELRPAGPGRITDIKYERGEPFVFQAELEVMPAIRLERTGGFQVSRSVAPVTDEEVESILDQIRDENAVWDAVDRSPETGDRVAVRISPLPAGVEEPEDEGTPYQLVLGAGQALDGVEAAIGTLSPDGGGVFSVEFPEDPDDRRPGGPDAAPDAADPDAADPGPDAAPSAGAPDAGDPDVEQTITRRLHIALDTVEQKSLPELSDELAAEIGPFESAAALEAAVREDLNRHHEREAEERVRGALMSALLEANPFVVPQALVDRYLENVLQAPEGTDPAELARTREAMGPRAERTVREQLVLEALIDREELRATPEEVEARITELAEARDVVPAKLRRDLIRENQLGSLKQNLAVEKAFAYLKDQSAVDSSTGF